MAAVFSKYKKQTIWIVVIFVVVCGIVALSFLAKSNQVSCTITVAGESSSYRMSILPQGDNNITTSYWLEPTYSIAVKEAAILEFEVPDDRETLVVEEWYQHYISHDVVSTSVESYTLEKNENGKFELHIGRKDHKKRYYDEAAAYVITYNEKMYSIKISFPAWERTLNQEYVSKECLFITSLSSYKPSDDTGKTYRMTDDVFYINDDETRASQKFEVDDWEWQKLPYTDEEWRKLCLGLPEEYNISELYQERLYKPLAWNYWLLQMDGELWLANIYQDRNSEMTVWSIYSLEEAE